MEILSPPAKDDEPPFWPGRSPTPKSILGYHCFNVAHANAPVPCMPTFPVSKLEKTLDPLSTLAPRYTAPSVQSRLKNCSAVFTGGEDASVACVPSALISCPPLAEMYGVKV